MAEIAPAPKDIRWRAMDLLARREMSRKELVEKLNQRFPEFSDLILEIVQSLKEEGLQSDWRFAEAYTAMRARKGFGPRRIAMELSDKGVDEHLAYDALHSGEQDWFELASKVWGKKYGAVAADLREKSKQTRFMMYRGFEQDHFEHCL